MNEFKPTAVKADKSERILTITWDDRHVS
ncbi:hypothetical protein MNBD_CHLOROFLEXI01-887, partial [hydrothermal vent metagenome]